MTFGSLLKKYRIASGFGLREYARKIGQHSSNYCKFETGKRSPPSNYKALDKLCAYLDITDSEFDMLIELAQEFHWNNANKKWSNQ